MNEVDIFKYLPEKQQREIAERVFTERMETEVHRIIEARHGDKNGNPCGTIVEHIMGNITDRYIGEMEPELGPTILKIARDKIINRTESTDDNNTTIDTRIHWAIEKLITDTVNAHSDELKQLLYSRILESVDSIMLNAFCADIIRTLDIDKAIREVLGERARGYQTEKK